MSEAQEPPSFNIIQRLFMRDEIRDIQHKWQQANEAQQQEKQKKTLSRQLMALQDTTAVSPLGGSPLGTPLGTPLGFSKFNLNNSSSISSISNQQKSRGYTNPLSYRQSYEVTSGEVVTFPPEAIDRFIFDMNANSTARPMLMARKRELTRNGLELNSKFACLCNVCGTKYDNVVEMCDECENTEDQYGFTLPDPDEKEIGEEWIDPSKNVNPNFQNLIELLKENQEYVDIVDDCWFVLENEYTTANGLILSTEVEEIWVKHPGNMSWSVHPQTNKIGRYKYTCVEHREFITLDRDALCSVKVNDKVGNDTVCGNYTYNVIAQSYKPGTNQIDKHYILNEVLHSSLHRPSALYGFPPAITLRYELALTTNQMQYMASYYDDVNYHKIPGYLLVPTGTSWEDLWENTKEMRRKLDTDPHQVGVLPYSPAEGGGKPEFVRFDTTPREMEFIPVRDEARQRMAAFYGVSPVFQADVSQGGGLNNEGLQFTVTNRAVEDAQQAMNRNVLAPLSRLIGLTDWVIELAPSEEQDEVAEIELKIKQAQYVGQVVSINPAKFEPRFNSQGELEVIENEVDDPDNPYDDLFSETSESSETNQNNETNNKNNKNKEPDITEQRDNSGMMSADKYQGSPEYKDNKVKTKTNDNKDNKEKMDDPPVLDLDEGYVSQDYYTFTRDIPEWEWSDDYEFVEFRTVEIGDINIHPDFEITEKLVDEGSSRVRPKTLVYYLAKEDTMAPLVVDSNQNLMDGHHRMYCLKVKDQKMVDIAVFKAKDNGSTFKKMKISQQPRVPKGVVWEINGKRKTGGMIIGKNDIQYLNDEQREILVKTQNWEEEKHPRDEDGKFTSAGSSSSSNDNSNDNSNNNDNSNDNSNGGKSIDDVMKEYGDKTDIIQNKEALGQLKFEEWHNLAEYAYDNGYYSTPLQKKYKDIEDIDSLVHELMTDKENAIQELKNLTPNFTEWKNNNNHVYFTDDAEEMFWDEYQEWEEDYQFDRLIDGLSDIESIDDIEQHGSIDSILPTYKEYVEDIEGWDLDELEDPDELISDYEEYLYQEYQRYKDEFLEEKWDDYLYEKYKKTIDEINKDIEEIQKEKNLEIDAVRNLFSSNKDSEIYTTPISIDEETDFYHGTNSIDAILQSGTVGVNGLYITTKQDTASKYGSATIRMKRKSVGDIFLDPDIWHPSGWISERRNMQYIDGSVDINNIEGIYTNDTTFIDELGYNKDEYKEEGRYFIPIEIILEYKEKFID